MSLVRVFKIQPPIGELVFGGAPQTFINVDWFRFDDLEPASREEWERQLGEFISRKRYFDGSPILVLGDKWSFTIGYSAP